MTATLARPAPLSRLWHDAPGYTWLALFLIAAIVPLTAALVLDARLFQDDLIWLKPIKFHVALSVYVLTLAFYARFMPDGMRPRFWRIFAGIIMAAILYEVVWVGAAAALGTASHFNDTSAVWSILYALAGVGAVTLTSASLAMGLSIRKAATGLPPALHLSLWLGLGLTFVLTVIVAGTMSSSGSHFVGVPATGASVPFMGWSREVGDLRVAHFLATHALHAIPLAGLIATRLVPARQATTAVIVASLGYSALVLGTFLQALAGLPLI
jgi:hypothetical protein